MRAELRSLITVPMLLSMACATVTLPEREALHLSLELVNQPRQLAVSVWVAPFFHDGSRRLLTVEPPEETTLVVTPRGEPIRPGAATEVLPAGTKVRVVSIDHPTGWALVSRPLVSPRERTWVELAVEGRDVTTSYVLVLPPDVGTREAALDALSAWLTVDDVRAEVSAMKPVDKHSVFGKLPLEGTSVRALELAMGRPYYRKRYGDGVGRVEEWTFRSDERDRVVFVRDGVVEQVMPLAEPASAAAAR